MTDILLALLLLVYLGGVKGALLQREKEGCKGIFEVWFIAVVWPIPVFMWFGSEAAKLVESPVRKKTLGD